MYTEENEFDYDDYLEEENNYNSKKPLIDFKFILKVIAIIALVILIIFLVFKIKNKNFRNNNTNTQNTNINNSALVMSNNLNMIRDAAREYFFEKDNLPKNVGESITINVKKLVDENLIVSVKDQNSNLCGYNTSNAKITRNNNDYQLVVSLLCIGDNQTVTYYYDLDGNCLTCNGENYESNNTNENNNIENNENKETNTNSDTNTNKETDDEIRAVCTNYSAWTTEKKNDSNLDVQTRTLVKGYKEEVVYGEYSEPTEEEIIATDTVDVKSYEETKQETKTTCSNESTTKPKSIEGREIKTRTETVKSTKTVCSGGGTYTRTLTKWDNSAYSCRVYGIGKFICTYKTSCTNKTVTTTKNITYYSYCDTETNDVTKTYYQSRPISKNIVYTDYLLESELPDGYKKLDGSEIIQYRYREKCGK